MTESGSFLPSEVARLVLGYIKSEGYTNTYKAFMKECIYLTEYMTLLKQGREFPLSVCGLTLSMMLDDYARLKLLDVEVKTGHTNKSLLWKQLESILGTLKLGDPDKIHKSFSQSASQGARMRRQATVAKSPQKTLASLRQSDGTFKLPVRKCGGEAISSGGMTETDGFDDTVENIVTGVSNMTNSSNVTGVSNVTSASNATGVSNVTDGSTMVNVSNITGVSDVRTGNTMANAPGVTDVPNANLSVPDIVSTDSCKRLQIVLEKNSPNPKSGRESSSATDSQLKAKSSDTEAESNSAICNKETADSNRPDKAKSVCDSSVAQKSTKVIENSALNCVSSSSEDSSTLKNMKRKISFEENNSKSVSQEEALCDQSEILSGCNAGDSSNSTNLVTRDSTAKEPAQIPHKPEVSEVTNSNTCDSWLNGAPGVKGGDKLLEKFGIQQASSSDSSDHEIAQHIQAPVTPSKSKPSGDTGLVTPVKQLQTTENTKSPRRKKPKTPRKRLSDVDKKASTSNKDQKSEDNLGKRVPEVIEPLLHDIRLQEKIAEISTVVLGKTRQNRSHHKSGDEKHELTADELETITASHSLEEILETESFGQDLNLDLSDPVFEGLFKLFGTDKEAFHENLRREKHKTDVMEAEVEELEKSIHEEIIACGTLMSSHGDEGYETQRTHCSSQTAASEMSSPVSQPFTPQHRTHYPSPGFGQSDGYSPSSHVTQPFSPALTEPSPMSVGHTAFPSTPSHNCTTEFSAGGDQTLEPESPVPHSIVSGQSPSGLHSIPYSCHLNPPASPDELPSIAHRRTPIPCSPLVKNDIQASTPHMVQKYNTPFTPQSNHKSVAAAGTVRHLFSPKVYSPGSQQNPQVIVETNFSSEMPQHIQEVEASVASLIQPSQTTTNQSMNYNNFVSGVSSGENRSTPINVRAKSLFSGDALSTINNTIGCISIPPSQSVVEMPPPPPEGKEKGKKGCRGKGKKAASTKEIGKVQQGGFSTLIGLLQKPTQLPSIGVQPATVSSALSMPVLTQETESHTVVLNAIPDDIHNDTISILSPGGQNYVEVPILHCQDEEIPHKISQSASQNDVNSENDTVCVWSQNLNTSTQLTIFSPPPENVVSFPNSELKAVDSDSVQKTKQSQWGKKRGACEKNQVPKNEKRKSSKKKLNLERADANNIDPPVSPAKSVPVENIGPVESLVIQDTSQDFFCCPGEVFTAEPLHVRAPQKKVFIKSLNFGPNASNTVGNLMPSRKVAKGSALAPFPKKKSSEFTTVSVNLTKDIKYRKIMPKPAASIAVNIQSSSQSIENIIPTEKNNVDDVLVVGDSLNDHYDSDTLSCGTISPVKFRKVGCKSLDQASSKSDVSKDKATSNLKGSAKESKVSKTLNKHKIEAVDEEKNIHSGRNSQKHKRNEMKLESGKPSKVSEEKTVEENTSKSVRNAKHGDDLAIEKNSSKVAISTNKSKAEARKRNIKNTADSNSLKDESLARSKRNLGKSSKLKDDGLKGTKKKNEKQLKVKIGSNFGKTQSDKNMKTPKLNKNVNKVFTKSPVTDTITNKQVLSDRIDIDSVDSDEDIPLKVLKAGLNRSKENHDTDKGSHKVSNETDIVSSSVAEAIRGKNEPKVLLVDICPSTPNKRTEKSLGECTPSKEQVLEKLGLTPQKNAKDILESMQLQSPSRTNIIDLLVQLTPISSDRSPSRRKRIQSEQKTDGLQSPNRGRKTPAKRLFGSPSARKNSGSNVEKVDHIPANTKETESVKNKHESVSKANLSSLVPNGESVLNSISVIEKVKALDVLGNFAEKHKVSVKDKEKVTRKGSTPPVKEVTLEKLQKESRKVTPLRIKDLYKNTKVAFDRNKESKVGRKRPRDSSDQELEFEANTVKPSKKARNSLDLSVLDYEKMMAKLSKLHK